jgi:hypothetical protein
MKSLKFYLLCCLASLIICSTSGKESDFRIALLITLTGGRKLSEYFEWNCRSIYHSKDLVDLLVFHENNQRLRNITCASNVKFINLGDRGLATLLSQHILSSNPLLIIPSNPSSVLSSFSSVIADKTAKIFHKKEDNKGSTDLDSSSSKSVVNEDTQRELSLVINNILLHMPKYLIEIKPMLGDLFQSYISSYSHWSYTDPDILWGNVADWVDVDDLTDFDFISFAKHWDAARLFLRGQVRIFFSCNAYNLYYLSFPLCFVLLFFFCMWN